MSITIRRETKYTRAVMSAVRRLGHATNAQIALAIRNDFPNVSDTTVHRITNRFHEDGTLGVAPKAADGAVRYDANTLFHDHFICEGCGVMRDVILPATVRREIQGMLDGCCLNGSLTLVGDCTKCKER